MATRNLLWLIDNGWEIHEPKGVYEAIRAKKDGKWIIVYRKSGAKEHFTVRDPDYWLIRDFYRKRRTEDGK